MKSKVFSAAGCVIATTVLLASACGGTDSAGDITTPLEAGADAPTAPETGGNDVTVTPTGECTVNADCEARLPTTTPPNCAVATCDTLQKKCLFKSKDADNDGHTAKNCSASTATIETGDDCDDSDPNSYPGAWDGPATDFDSGAGVESDRCDQKDNDCNGSPDDGKLAVDGGDKTCKCDPNKPLPCYEYPNGTPISASTLDANNTPKGICKKGTRSCTNGIPGACVGAVGPDPVETCDDADRDCDGISGNAGDTVPSAPLWFKDIDNDNYGDKNVAAKQQCVAPGAGWKTSIPNTDCNDDDAQMSPGNVEVCDSKDNNCNGSFDEGVTSSFCADNDTDGYCTATCVQACSAPAGYRAQNTCSVGLDCNDGAGAVHPGAVELCGDGIDSNCMNGDSDPSIYPNLGQACTAGTAGVCKRAGTYICQLPQRTSTTCSVTAGAAGAATDTMSNDPLIDMSQVRTGYDPRWDWDCNSVQEVVTPLEGGTFRGTACGHTLADFQAACATFTTDAACNIAGFGSRFFSCEHVPNTNFWYDPSDVTMCGHTHEMIGCLWIGGSCKYTNNWNPAFAKTSCR